MNRVFQSILPPRDFGWNRVRARCASPDCHNKLLTRAVPQSRIGIQAGTRWYCSVDCFVSAAGSSLAALAAGRVVEMPRNPRLSLGLALLSRGYVTEDQLRFAAESSSLSGDDLETTLLRLGIAGEKQLAGARAAQWGYPVLAHEFPNQTLTTDFPRVLMREFVAVPLYYSTAARKLFLGFVHRVDHRLLQAVEQITGCRPEPCFLTPSEFDEQMRNIDLPPGYEEAVVEESRSPERMARMLGGYASETAAREIAFVRCKSHLWARLKGKSRIVDVLFSLRNTGLHPKAGNPATLWETVGSLR